MRYKVRPSIVLLATLLSLAGVAIHAGSSDGDPGSTFLTVGIIEGPDPIPQAWDGDDPPEAYLNAPGSALADDRPDLGLLPGTGYPVMVWADDSGSDRDIAFSQWDDDGWPATPIYLTAGLGDERDPRIHVQGNGALQVVWWEDDSSDRVYLASRPAGSRSWSEPSLILASGRRPSIAASGDGLLVAYERDAASGDGQEIVVATRDAAGEWNIDVVASTTRTERLDVTIHADARRVWLEWTHGDNLAGLSSYRDGRWVAPDDVSRFGQVAPK